MTSLTGQTGARLGRWFHATTVVSYPGCVSLRDVAVPEALWETWGLLSNLGGFVIRIRILCILHVSCMYFPCILMYMNGSHQDTPRYIKIHQDTFVSISLVIMEMYLTLGYVSFFRIHLGYIHVTFQDTMYLTPQIHDTQDTCRILDT